MKIGIVAKKGSIQSYRVARELLVYGYNVLGLEMLIDKEVSKELEWSETFSIDSDKVDFLLVIGGDGTLLRAIQRLKYIDTPVMGIRTGRRGFLLDVDPKEALDRLRDLLEGRYSIYEYMRLRASLGDNDVYYALNEFVIANVRDTRSRVITLRVNIDSDPLYSIDGDGVIVSTPLGSTAYAFSAGGPIVDADMEAIIVAPLAPMQTNAKPVVLSPKRTIEVVNISEDDIALCIADGETTSRIRPGGSITITKAERGVKFVRFKKFETYRRVQIYEH